MAGSLGTLVLELAANSARLQSDMGKAVGIVERGISKMTSLSRGLAGGALVAGIAAAASKAIQFGDDLNKASIKAGIGARAISELAYAARLSDIDLSSLSNSLKKMQVALSEASTGAKGPNEALRALGLRIEDIKSLAADQQFELIADRINQLKDPADRARAAVDLFGKSGADLLPLFEQGAAGIRKAREEAERMGLSFSDKQVKALAEADDAVKRLKASWEGFAVVLTSKGAPAIAAILDLLRGDANGLFGGGGSRTGSLDQQLKFAESRLALAVQGGYAPRIKEMREEVERLNMAINGVDDFASRQSKARSGTGAPQGYDSGAEYWSQILKDMTELDDVQVTGKKVGPARMIEEYDAVLQQAASDTEEFARLLEDLARPSHDLLDLTNDQIVAEQERQRVSDEMTDTMVANLQDLYSESEKTFDGMSVYADQAARNMQDAFAEFLFNPFDDGLKGMLRGFVDIIRRMAAEAAAAQIFGSKAEGGFGLGDLFRIGVGAAFNSGGGGSSSIPTGPTTAELFAAGPSSLSESIAPSSMGSGGANKITVAPVYNIDARGASQDLVKALPAILEANNRQVVAASVAAMRDDMSRRGTRQ